MGKVVLLGVGGFFALTLLAFMKVNRAEPEPFMDEVLHVPQCQSWCKGNFTWNNWITTLPGLYIVAGGLLETLEWTGYLLDPCTTFNLRLVSLILNTLSLYICFLIIGRKFPELPDGKNMASALVCASTPLLWFYSFMFYTEPPATFFLLLMHHFWMKKSYSWSAFLGAWAVLCRQTNIVWVLMYGLMTFTSVLDNHTQFFHSLQRYLAAMGKKTFLKVLKVKSPDVNPFLLDHEDDNNKHDAMPKGQLVEGMDEQKIANHSLSLIVQGGVALVLEFLTKCSGYLIAGIAFCAFVKLNGGIVVGDSESHEVNFNSPQILYFSLFVGILSLPSVFSGKGKRTWDFICNNLCITLAIYFLFFLLVHYNTGAHRYNLGDPQHMTHYFVTAVYHEPNLRYYLLPFYTFFWIFICINLAQSMGKVATGFFVLITCLNLIPQLLLEFRYFVPAFLFFRLNLRVNSWKVLLGELVLLNSINLITVAVLIHRLVEFPSDSTFGVLIW